MLLTDATAKVEHVADAGCIPVRKQIQTTAHGGDRASEHPCLSEAKILSLWHNFNISGCTYGPREIQVPARWCCFASSSFGWCSGWGYFRGAAWPPSLLLLFFSLLFGGCCLPSPPSLGGVAFFLSPFAWPSFPSSNGREWLKFLIVIIVIFIIMIKIITYDYKLEL